MRVSNYHVKMLEKCRKEPFFFPSLNIGNESTLKLIKRNGYAKNHKIKVTFYASYACFFQRANKKSEPST